MKKTNSAVGLMVLAWGSLASAQTGQTPAAAPAPDNSELGYIGGSMRIGVGYDDKTRLRGEMYTVLSESETRAILGEAWVAKNAGGLKLSYNFIPEARVRSIDPAVIKTFIAADRNTEGDAKATIGAGFEKQDWFGGIYGAAAITRRREISNTSTTNITTIQGNDGRPYVQDVTTLTNTRIWERPYDYGVGARVGRFWESTLIRLYLGADYEWGHDSAKQTTFSAGVEKFFYNSPISLSLNVEHYHKSGGIDASSDDNRVMAMLRYEFGGPNFRPNREYKMVEVQTTVARPQPAPVPAPVVPVQPAIATPAPVVVAAAPQVRREKRLVKTTAAMAAEEFFEFDRSTLTPTARSSLDKVIEQLKTTGFTGNLHLVGHTCNIGSAAYNQKLSERRANAVKKYLVEQGGIQADVIYAEGKGLTEPKYPNTKLERHKNRRVDLEFVTYEDKVEEIVVPVPAVVPTPVPVPPPVVQAPPAPLPPVTAVEWKREVIDVEPSWLRRALRQSVPHKMTVDTYRQKEASSTTSVGDKHYINQPPVAVNDAFTVAFNSSANSLNVLANDSDPDSDPLTITAVTQPLHGGASISAGRINYTPLAGYQGTDQFSYTISDGQGHTATAQVTITVSAPVITNHPPVAGNDAFTVPQNSTGNSFNVLSNDSDPDGDTLTITAVATPLHGTATISAGRVIYTPATGYNGTDRFIYTISDGKGESAIGTVNVTVTPVSTNQPPVAANDAFTVPQNSSNNSLNVLANDSDPDGDTLTITAVTAPAHGTAAIASNRVTYTPTTGYSGTDTFSYTIADGKGGTATATVTMTVTPAAANRPPVAANDAFTVATGSTNNSLDVLANDSDPDGDALSITGTTTPQHGTALVLNNKVLYTPAAGYTGIDTFTYTITDGKGLTATATVTITVGTGNRVPVARNDVFTVNQNSTANTFDVLANDSDPDGDTLTITSAGTPAHGTSTIANGRIVYTPTAGYQGSDTFTYAISDGKGGTATATVTVSVVAANGPPVARDDQFRITQNVTSLNVLANDSDPDNDPLTIVSVTQPVFGKVAIAADGKTVTYTKLTTFNMGTFTYTISDGRGGTSTATVTLTDP